MPVFADTNVVVYAFGRDLAKVERAEAILGGQPNISTQVISKFLNVARVKLGLDLTSRHRIADELLVGCNVVAVDSYVIAKAMDIERQAGNSYWDALIIAAAVMSGCGILYSEDLQQGHVFEGRRKVENPFA